MLRFFCFARYVLAAVVQLRTWRGITISESHPRVGTSSASMRAKALNDRHLGGVTCSGLLGRPIAVMLVG